MAAAQDGSGAGASPARKRPPAAAERNGKKQRECCEILRPPHGDETVEALAERLRRGLLVAFPTETVYGLGANGLDAEAVLKIFSAKGRPLSDPCILHVASAPEAEEVLALTSAQLPVFRELARACWPGPLSIVAKAQEKVPDEVTASTGFVAVRCPDHALARRLIAAAGVPLAAPSANRFGHISPTLPEHVEEDLGHVETLRILDGGACGVGIESTVLRLEEGCLRILRKGGVTRERLIEVLAAGRRDGRLQAEMSVEYSEQLAQGAEALRKKEREEPTRPLASPGLLLRHYAPSVPTALLDLQLHAGPASSPLPEVPDSSVLVDFKDSAKWAHAHFKRVFRMGGGEQASVEDACAQAFATLRAAEAYAVSEQSGLICITDFEAKSLGGVAEALHDRMFRAASGRRLRLVGGPGEALAFVEKAA